MRFAISLPNAGHFADVDVLARLAGLAEQEGWDGFFLWDHVLFQQDPPVDVVEPWTTLAAIAATTERITIGTLITPLARYEPWALARTLATLDQLSRGRVLLGVGEGSPDEDFLAFWPGDDDEELARRRSRYREALELLPRLLRAEPVDHAGTNFTVRDVTLLPGAYGGRTIPIWVGGGQENEHAVARAQRHAGAVPLARGDDGWPRAMTFGEVRDYRARLGPDGDLAYWNQTEIDPLTAERAAEMESAGATWWIETTKDGTPEPGKSGSIELIETRIRALSGR
jgi:alkanesulfonate monooxygenase SsuD/methylene tetrahydromethanopterin reductase-like flavin-dependent oxidoreductase (luciferase family)